jgi:hypothetical protein
MTALAVAQPKEICHLEDQHSDGKRRLKLIEGNQSWGCGFDQAAKNQFKLKFKFKISHKIKVIVNKNR